MNPATISALAALIGSFIGGLTSVATAWVLQRSQAKAGEVAAEKKRRQILYKMFIDEASRLYGDALEHDNPQVAALVRIYALVSRMRVLSSPPVIEAADKMVRKIVDTYLEPNRTFVEVHDMLRSNSIDPLREFSEVARKELEP
jgi:hypothetical protein